MASTTTAHSNDRYSSGMQHAGSAVGCATSFDQMMVPHREQQRTAMYVVAAVCSTQIGGFGSHKAIDPLEMWPVTVCASQRRAMQHAGVGDVGALAKPWGLRVQALLRGSW